MKIKIIKDVNALEEMPALTQNDTISLTLNFKHDDDSYFDLTNYDEIRFKGRLTHYNTSTIDLLGSISAGTSGVGVLDFTPTQLETSGVYFTEISCSSSSEVRTVSAGKLYVVEEL